MNNREERLRFLKGVLCGVLVSAVVSAVGIYGAKKVYFGKESMNVSEKAAVIASMLEENYIGDFENTELCDQMYSGMASAMGDPYTEYMNEKQMTEFLSEAGGSICGIGVVITEEDGKCVIREVLDNSPAQKAGLSAGDILLSVDGNDTNGMSVVDISSLTKGREGTTVDISILRDGNTLDFQLRRSMIDICYVTAKQDGNIGYIKISEFTKVTANQFDEKLDELMSQDISGLIIDLRDNPGGMIDIVTKIADRLLPEGIVTYTVDKNGNRRDFVSDSEYVDIPVAVLVNGGSASASELLTGALQDSGRGVIIGTQTYGKGIVQGLYTLSDGSGLKITIQKYYTPKGVCIQGVGITPDFVIESDDTTTGNDDKQYRKAVEILNDKE